ncbi:MAG: glycosyltransferase family 2 protein [Candidatus Melainabacteria bacterium]|nr:glycosyltransferase family 2 protein [Candidatus Melainabacteria bacterium]
MEHKPFVIVVPSYNSPPVEKNLSTIFAQKYDNYRVVYLDATPLGSVEESVERHQMGHRVQIVHNEGIYEVVHACAAGEIVVLLDADDWFPHEHVLERLNEIYADPQVWLMFGSYLDPHTVVPVAPPVPKRGQEMEQGLMPTFYASLFNKIAERDLLHADAAMMVPMVEMAGGHLKYVQDVLCVHTRAAPKYDEAEIAQHMLTLPRYKPIHSLEEKTL